MLLKTQTNNNRKQYVYRLHFVVAFLVCAFFLLCIGLLFNIFLNGLIFRPTKINHWQSLYHRLLGKFFVLFDDSLDRKNGKIPNKFVWLSPKSHCCNKLNLIKLQLQFLLPLCVYSPGFNCLSRHIKLHIFQLTSEFNGL